MTKGHGPVISTLAILAAVAGLAGVMVVREPDLAWMFILAALFMPLAWILIEVFKFQGVLAPSRVEDRAHLRRSLRSAGVLLAIPLALTIVFTSGISWITDAMEVRIMAVGFGVGVILIADFIPKQPASMTPGCASAAQRQAFARFAGRTLMLTGIAYIITAFITPDAYSAPALMLVAVTGAGLVLARGLLMALRGRARA